MINPSDEKYIKALGKGRKMSQVQIDLCNFAAHGIGNATVQSRAGSGKSKTIELMALSINPNKSILILAHNIHIKNELKDKLKDCPNITVLTYHSLGFSLLKYKYYTSLSKDSVYDDKYKEYVNNNINEISTSYSSLNISNKYRYKKNILKLIDYARYNLAQSPKEILKIAMKYDVEIIHDEHKIASNVLKWGSSNIDKIDYQDMIWLPYELGMASNIKKYQYDFIFVDEAQDSSLAQQNLINLCKNRSSRFVVFGDEFQTINDWCGADSDAFKHFEKMDNMKIFHLNVSYRCSKSVAEFVRQKIKDFETPDNAIIGSVNHNVPLSSIKPGDMVLCRHTAPLIKLYAKLLTEGKSSKIAGFTIGKELIEQLKFYQTESKNNDFQLMIDNKYKELINIWDNISEKNKCTLRDAITEPIIIELYDEIKCFEALKEKSNDINEIITTFSNMFVDENNMNDKNVIHLSTVHRAKGLESNNVFILCPSLMPSKLAKKEWELASEENIIYVAWSRAKNSLNFIDEKEFRPDSGYNSLDEMYKTLKNVNHP